MDISPDISAGDQQVSGSDKASPATMNSSSNTTFTPPAPDRPFPHTQSQHTNTGDSHQHPSKPVTNANLALFSQTPDDLPADISFAQYFDAVTDAPPEPAGIENPFAMPAGWEPPAPQQSSQSAGGQVSQEAGPSPQEGGQFEQMLQGMGWDGWR